MPRGGRSGGGRSRGGRSGGGQSRGGRIRSGSGHRSKHHSHSSGLRKHRRHHHSGGGGEADCDCSCCTCTFGSKLEFSNPYEGNPNVISLVWNRKGHRFNEDDLNLSKMESQGYNTEPVKRIIGELNALSRSINFNDQPPEYNELLFCLCCLLGFFPIIFYLIWFEWKNLDYLEGEKKFREASQPIILHHNEMLTRNSRYYLEAGEFYPYVLAIHLMRENQNGSDPNNPQITVNNPQLIVNNPNMIMNDPNMMAGQQLMANQSQGQANIPFYNA